MMYFKGANAHLSPRNVLNPTVNTNPYVDYCSQVSVQLSGQRTDEDFQKNKALIIIIFKWEFSLFSITEMRKHRAPAASGGKTGTQREEQREESNLDPDTVTLLSLPIPHTCLPCEFASMGASNILHYWSLLVLDFWKLIIAKSILNDRTHYLTSNTFILAK